MRRLVILLATLALASCATAQRLGAANDAHALLLSIRNDDVATFDAHVDRPALKRQIEGLIVERTNKRYGGLASLLAPGLADFAGDTLIQPQVFKAVARQYGYGDDAKIPNPIAIAAALKTLPDGRVCATRKKDGPCVLTFTKEAGAWKLTSFDGDFSTLRIKL